MDYKKIHDAIIDRAKSRSLPKETYTERHHIVPRCMGGDNNKTNLVRLTAEEHFVVHQLLVKMFPDNHKLVFALHRMTHKTDRQIRSNKMYGWIKKRLSASNPSKLPEFAIAQSIRMKLNNPMHNPEVAKRHSAFMQGKQMASGKNIGNKNAVGCKHGPAWYALQSAKMIGNKNSVGTSWITDGASSKKIISGQLIPLGWHKGRLVNWGKHGVC